MTPAEQTVIEAARAWSGAGMDDALGDSARALWDAVAALDAEREAGIEQEITWGQVVESDKIFSARTGKWYEVISAVDLGDGRTRVQAKGLPKPITPGSAGSVLVRRGPTGQTVDMWNVVWSAQTIPTIRESEEAS